MLIIAKRKDYYDGVAGSTGIDKTLVYERETLEVENIPTLFRERKGYWSSRKTDTPFYKIDYHSIKKQYRGKEFDEYAFFIIGFCGKLYVGWKLYRELEPVHHTISTEYTYDIEYMKEMLQENSWRGNFIDHVNYIIKYDALELFRNSKTPAFVYDGDYGRTTYDKRRSIYNSHNPKFFVNPLLKDYEFYKVFDSFQAFQEISMFIGGVLGRGEEKIIEVEDKYKIAQHGFDKWSFRKEPK